MDDSGDGHGNHNGDDNAVVELPALELSDDLLSDFLLDFPDDLDPSRAVLDFPVGGENSNSPSPMPAWDKEQGKTDDFVQKDNTDDNDVGEDPNSKKRQRQLRNVDEAKLSRDRKKMYVRDLEMKSRYLEGECRRLGMLLHGCVAENQALRLSLQKAKAFDASMTKQESAVPLMDETKFP